MSRDRHVDAMKAEGFPVRAACEAAEVSTSAYYEWRQRTVRGPGDRHLAERSLLAEIGEIQIGPTAPTAPRG